MSIKMKSKENFFMGDESSLIQRRGLMLVLSSPSGAGKSSISKALLALDDNLRMSISLTTRGSRPGEVHGQDYFFVDDEYFSQAIAQDDLMEYAKVFDHYYGTPKQPVMEVLDQGKDVLFDIDWQGTQQLEQAARGDLVTIFVLPPSWEELETRLINRAQDSADVVARRMSKAVDEMSHWAEYDYVIVNKDLPKTIGQAHAILVSERLKRQRQNGLSNFVKNLRQKV